jgi:heme oxygenase (biliverdin-IX-beta and delta-forming)
MTTVQTEKVMDRLKRETHDQHMAMHRNPLMDAVMAGDATRQQYVAQLTELYHIHHQIETAFSSESADINMSVTGDQYRSPILYDDLRYLTGSLDFRNNIPLAPTREALFHLQVSERKSPENILGAVYVLEGSIAGGGSLLKEAVSRSLGLKIDGTKYLNGHGPSEKAKFREFGERMNSALNNPETQDGVIQTAQQLFTDLDRLYSDIAA